MLGCLFCWLIATMLLAFPEKLADVATLTLEFRIIAAIGFIFVGSISRAASALDDFATTFKGIFSNAKMSVEKESAEQ